MLIPLKGELAEKDLRLAAVIGLPFWFQAIRVGITLACGVPTIYVLILLRKKDSVYSLVTRSLFANDEDWECFQQHVRATVSRKHK